MEHGVEAWGPMDPKEGPAIEPVETLPFYRHSGDKGDSPEVSCACGRVGEREGEKHPCVVASHATPAGDLAHNPGMCPDWESNLQPFGSQACAQSTELRQPGLIYGI